jgi:hypothetical protein
VPAVRPYWKGYIKLALVSCPIGRNRADRQHHDEKGLSIRCDLDPDLYPKGIKVSDAEMATLNITRDAFHPEWNYRIAPMNTT